MKPLRSIIVGIDFSRPSINALRGAARIARSAGIDLTVVHVVDRGALEEMASQVDLKKIDVAERARARLEEFVEQHLRLVLPVHFEVLVGHPFEEIVSVCERKNADLLVMGAQGNSGRGWRTGVLATNCVRRAPVDVLLVRGFQDKNFKKILVCVDFSETAKRAVEQGIMIALQDRAAVEFLFVFQPVNEMTGDLAAFVQIMPPLNNADYRKTAEKDLEAFLQPFLEGVGGLEVRTTVIENSRVSDAIIDRANDSGANLVVLGTRGRTGFKRLLFMGTTAERIVAEAPCSVFSVKPREE